MKQTKLGRGGVLGQGKGSSSGGKKAVYGILVVTWYGSQLCWQHAKIIFLRETRGLSMSIAKPMEVELIWILFKGLKHFIWTWMGKKSFDH